MFLKDIILRRKNDERIAIKFSNEEISYKNLYSKSNSISKSIKEQVYSENIGLFLPNSIDYAVAYFSITLNKSIIVPISILSKELEIVSSIRYCELNLIITNSEYKKLLIKSVANSNFKIAIYNIDDNSFEEVGNGDYCNIMKKSSELNVNDTAIMLHTSGTTSNPKRVMLTHNNLISNIKSNIESLKLTKDDKVLIALPMCFGYCNTAQFLTHLFIGGTIIIMKSIFMAKSFFQLVENDRITNFTAVPTMLLLLLEYKNKTKYDISSLRFICFGGGHIPKEKLKLLIDIFNSVGFIQTYGQTEASPRVTALLSEDSIKKIGSVGKPIPNIRIKIIDNNGCEVEQNQKGEIIVQGDNIMKGYYKQELETNKTIRNGWLHTGDLGKIDEDGYLYIVGRKKNVIICGGLNIYPEEVEEILMLHNAIKEACVIGIEDYLLGEVPIAKIVLKKQQSVTEEDIINYCVVKLAKYKVPHKVDFVDNLTKTNTGKIIRY